VSANAEIELLLRACIANPVEAAGRDDLLLAGAWSDLDWNRLIRTAVAQGVMPLLYRYLNLRGCPIPAQARVELHARFQANALRSAQIAHELARLMELFEANGIPALSFKGPLLSLMAYGDVSMRQFVDLDVLVPKSHVPHAASLLISSGYRARTYDREGFEADFFRNTSDEFVQLRGLSVVDLHWELLPWFFPFGPDNETLWSRSEQIELDGQQVKTLGSSDLLLFLCVHAAKHGWPDLASVADVAALLRAREIDLDAILAEASRLRSYRMLLVGLYLVHRLMRVKLPEAVLKRIFGDSKAIVLGGRIADRLMAGREPGPLNSWQVALGAIERPRDRIRFVVNLGLLPTAGDRAAVVLPRALYPLYYLVRPLRLAVKGTALMRRPRETVPSSTRGS
jgi:hypothetical protein